MFALICATLLGAANAAVAQPALNGSWTGVWVRAGDDLAVTMHFKQEGPGWVGSFDSDRLRVIGIPLREVIVALPAVQWKVVGDATTMNFRGEVRGTTLTGEFEERGTHGTFRLERIEREPQQPEERELTFRNGDVVLSGTLLLPSPSANKFPAMLFLHGSGAEGRWASKYLATRFARAGIAALIYDKRGVGQSTGSWRTATSDDLAGDAAAAVEELRKAPEIDPQRIGIHGHSQGGTLTPLVAAKRSNVAFIIASSAAGLPLDQVEIFSLENSIGIRSLPPAEAKFAHKYIATFVATAYNGAPRQKLLDLWKKVQRKPWAIEPPPEGNYYWSFSRKFAKYDPIAYWRRVTSPVLLVYGANDERVPARASAVAITNALTSSAAESVSVRIFANADHTIRLPSTGAWPATPPGYPDLLIEWTRRVTGLAN